ncbi:hypothetical protein BC941DRAFT_450501 [Chlamydoabsidia padenii]|nr:hypothetical protein BC941DRAFT_450501 [Chlamydoabsidia padenii]
MDKKKQDGIMHACLLVTLQWISLTIVILNVVALRVSKEYPQLQNKLISSHSGPQDIVLIVVGVLSFLTATLLLCLHLTVYYRSQPFASTKLVWITELVVGVVMVIFWTAASSIILTHFHVSSNCRLDIFNDTSACKILNIAIMIGLGAIAGWILLLIIASIGMSRLTVTPTFILESNPYLGNENGGYLLEKQLSAAPSYSSLPPPPPSLSDGKRKSDIRYSHFSTDVGYSQEYPSDVKYPIYSIDSLPIIQVGGSKFDDLSFMQ